MINFRYHIVSLTAIFLALGVGVLFGAVFVPEQTVRTLETAQEALRERNEDLRGQVEELQETNDGLAGFATASRDLLISGVLEGHSVMLISEPTVAGDVLDDAEASLVRAGADVVGSLMLDEGLELATESQRTLLAATLGVESGSSEELHTQLVERLLETLAGNPGFLADLVENGLASTRDVAGAQVGDPGTFPTAGTAVVLVVDPSEEIGVIQENVIRPIVEADPLPGLIALADVGGGGTLLRLVRGEIGTGLFTVDSLAGPIGQTALVLGLDAAFEGRTGHYGLGPGATDSLPPHQPAPQPSP